MFYTIFCLKYFSDIRNAIAANGIKTVFSIKSLFYFIKKSVNLFD